ncbi:MAG: hypothetical protein ACR2PG_12965, partial [Hyphomicrobiaceae bacterium]
LDVWYIKNASLKLDLKVSWLTFATLIGGERPNGWAVDQARDELGIGKRVELRDASFSSSSGAALRLPPTRHASSMPASPPKADILRGIFNVR